MRRARCAGRHLRATLDGHGRRSARPELKARGKTVLVITHDDKYFHLADRFIKLDYGKIEQGHTDRFKIIAGRLLSLTTV